MVVSERGRCVLHIVPHTPHVRQACTGRREGEATVAHDCRDTTNEMSALSQPMCATMTSL